jgi:hypothetical protein
MKWPPPVQLGVHSKLQAVIAAARLGLIDVETQ